MRLLQVGTQSASVLSVLNGSPLTERKGGGGVGQEDEGTQNLPLKLVADIDHVRSFDWRCRNPLSVTVENF